MRYVELYKANNDLIYHGDYYRLSFPSEDKLFAAWEHISPDRQEALVSLAAGSACSAPPFYTLRVKGLDSDMQYQVDQGDVLYNGETLMQAGYPYRFCMEITNRS